MWQGYAVCGALIAFLFWAYTGQVERRVEAEVSAATTQISLDYAHETAKMSQDFNDKLGKQEDEAERILGEKQVELDAMRDTALKAAQNDPVGFGDSMHIKLARRMCLIEAASNREDRETCNNAPDEAFISNKYVTVTITQDNAEAYAELCDDGQKDFCEWSRTGLTANDWITLLGYFDRVDTYALAQGDQIDGLHDIIKQITKEPEGAKE